MLGLARPARSYRLVAVIAVAAVAAVAAGCSSDDDGSPATAVRDGTAVATGDAPVPTAAAGTDDVDADDDEGAAAGSVECDTVRPDLETVLLQWQVYAQLPAQDSVDDWGTVLGDPAEFAAAAERLRVLGGDDVAESLDTFVASAAIAERGIAGDATALADIQGLLGTDLTSALAVQLPVGQAFTDAGC